MTNPSFRITRLSPDLFRQLFAMSDTVLHQRGACCVFAADEHMMIDAEVCEGVAAAQLFARFLTNPYASYLHVHNARRGCHTAQVVRA